MVSAVIVLTRLCFAGPLGCGWFRQQWEGRTPHATLAVVLHCPVNLHAAHLVRLQPPCRRLCVVAPCRVALSFLCSMHLSCLAAGEVPGCDAHLTCARPVAAKTGGVTDIKCTVGSVCASHGVPIKQGFLSGETPEQFAHYVALLVVLKTLLPTVTTVLLDINCQFGKHMQSKYPSIAAGLAFYIGWLHARAGHNIDCQLSYSAAYQTGMGRCVGELIEQLWVRIGETTGPWPVLHAIWQHSASHKPPSNSLHVVTMTASRFLGLCVRNLTQLRPGCVLTVTAAGLPQRGAEARALHGSAASPGAAGALVACLCCEQKPAHA
jgi:hypothetical protein